MLGMNTADNKCLCPVTPPYEFILVTDHTPLTLLQMYCLVVPYLFCQETPNVYVLLPMYPLKRNR